MQDKQSIITYAYHFLCEAFIIFLLALPILYSFFHIAPYWRYIAVVTGICLLFSIFTLRASNYALYISSAPFLMLFFYVTGFPLLFSILFPVLLTWRYLNIRSDIYLNREQWYIWIMLTLSVILILLIRDNKIAVYPFLLVIILFFGYNVANLTAIHPEDRKQFNWKLGVYITGLFALGSAGLFFLFDSGRFLFMKAWHGFNYIFLQVAGFITKPLSLIDFDGIKNNYEDQEIPEMGQDEEENTNLLLEDNTPSIDTILSYIYWIVGMVAACVVLFFAIRYFKKSFQEQKHAATSMEVSYSRLDEHKKDKNFFQRVFGGYLFKPDHPVRKLVYQFERKTARSKYGRYSFETIENWFERIGMHANLAVYQKVRYGIADVNEQEYQDLKKELEEIEAKLGD